ncbi:MAG: hypothetical protein R3B06_15175 [Kofleriaceae bacterium]
MRDEGVEIPASIVVVPADRAGRFAAHEAFVEAGRISTTAADDDASQMPSPPTLAQLVAAVELGAIERPRTAERVAGFVTPADPAQLCAATGVGWYELLFTPAGPMTASPFEFPAVVRAATSVRHEQWCRLQVAVVPRTGRGRHWPAVRVVRGGAMTHQPLLLDRGSEVIARFDDGAWAWISADDSEHPCGWVPVSCLEAAEVAGERAP